MSKTGIVLSKRDSIIDTSRGLALILMIIGHLGMKTSFVQFIYSFHMPLFFFISDMTATRNMDSFLVFVNKRIKRLLVPYILFAFIFSDPGIKEYLFVFMGSRQGLVAASSLTPLWFLPCIFITDLILYFILKYLIVPDKKSSILAGGYQFL